MIPIAAYVGKSRQGTARLPMSGNPDRPYEDSMPGNHDPRDWVVRDPTALGHAIRHHRTSQGLGQEQLASAAGIHRSYLSDLEQGKATEQTARIFRVLRRLGLEIVVRPRK